MRESIDSSDREVFIGVKSEYICLDSVEVRRGAHEAGLLTVC